MELGRMAMYRHAHRLELSTCKRALSYHHTLFGCFVTTTTNCFPPKFTVLKLGFHSVP